MLCLGTIRDQNGNLWCCRVPSITSTTKHFNFRTLLVRPESQIKQTSQYKLNCIASHTFFVWNHCVFLAPMLYLGTIRDRNGDLWCCRVPSITSTAKHFNFRTLLVRQNCQNLRIWPLLAANVLQKTFGKALSKHHANLFFCNTHMYI